MERDFPGQDLALTQALDAIKNYVDGTVEERVKAAIQTDSFLFNQEQRPALLNTKEAYRHIRKSRSVLDKLIEQNLVDVYTKKGSGNAHFFLLSNLVLGLAEYEKRKNSKRRK